jgi:lycopene cyclase domain-containing protein
MRADITVFGRYTYLVTIVFWGAVAGALLHRAGALRRAAKTILLLYPVAYLWDWYTLEVGVFDIIERTGIEVAGIPLEEHGFIVVVPSLVLGFHETIHEVSDAESEVDSASESA